MKKLKLTNGIALIILFALLSAVISAIVYYTAEKEKSVFISIYSTGEKNEKSEGNELRIFYIEADGERINLKQFENSSWHYDGSLITYTTDPLILNLNAAHTIRLSVKRGEWTPVIKINVNNAENKIDLYSENDNTQYIKDIPLTSFWQTKYIFSILTFILFLCVGFWIYNKIQLYWIHREITQWSLTVFLSILGAVLFLMAGCAHAPWNRGWISRNDISVFISAGKLVNQGMIPYREIFDHKGPVLFWVNALGCALWYPYGIWIIEILFQLIGYIFCYQWLNQRFNRTNSLLATIFTIIASTQMVNMGDYSESWALPFCFIGLYIFSLAYQNIQKLPYRYIIICGISCSIVMFLRPNCVVPWVIGIVQVIILNISQRQYMNLIKQGLLFLSGVFIITVPICLYFYTNNALSDFVDFAFFFNLGYAKLRGNDLKNKIKGLVQLYQNLKIPFFTYLAILAIVYERVHQKTEKIKFTEVTSLYGTGMIAYILVFSLMNGISGRSYSHYGIILLPALGIIAALCIECLWGFLEALPIRNMHKIIVVIIVYIMIIKPSYIMGYQRIMGANLYYPNANISSVLAADYIETNTKIEERYGAWGDGAFIQTVINRLPATRYIYSNEHNIMCTDYDFGMKNLNIYMEELQKSNPQYFIVDQNPMPDQVKQYLNENYEKDEGFIELDKLTLYKRKQH